MSHRIQKEAQRSGVLPLVESVRLWELGGLWQLGVQDSLCACHVATSDDYAVLLIHRPAKPFGMWWLLSSVA
eukprot:2042083-Amphidinium_carterae.1